MHRPHCPPSSSSDWAQKEQVKIGFSTVTKRTAGVACPIPSFHDISSQHGILKQLPQKKLDFGWQLCLPNPSVVAPSDISFEIRVHRLRPCSEHLHSTTPLPELVELQLKTAEQLFLDSIAPGISWSWWNSEQAFRLVDLVALG